MQGHVRFPKRRTAYGHRPYNGLVSGWSYRSLSYPASGFYKPTFKVRIPLLPSPNVSEKYCPSPLLVTVRNKTDGSEETERLIKRKAAVGNTGKELISKALRTVIMSGDSPDKKINVCPNFAFSVKNRNILLQNLYGKSQGNMDINVPEKARKLKKNIL